MADNVIYIAAGIIPNDTGEAENSNEIFIAAGIVPDDKAAEGISIPVAMQNMRGGFNPIGMRGGFINAD